MHRYQGMYRYVDLYGKKKQSQPKSAAADGRWTDDPSYLYMIGSTGSAVQNTVFDARHTFAPLNTD